VTHLGSRYISIITMSLHEIRLSLLEYTNTTSVTLLVVSRLTRVFWVVKHTLDNSEAWKLVFRQYAYVGMSNPGIWEKA